jgi:hypothetical protein
MTFYGCVRLGFFIFDDHSDVRRLGTSALENCFLLESVGFPPSLQVIGFRCFAECHRLSLSTFEPYSKLRFVGDSAFKNCYALTTRLPPKAKILRQLSHS